MKVLRAICQITKWNEMLEDKILNKLPKIRLKGSRSIDMLR